MPSPIVLDTCALIFDALSPERLSKGATKAIEAAERHDLLFCSDMSLWEITILMQKGRLSVDTDTSTSDTCVILANGLAGEVDEQAFFEALVAGGLADVLLDPRDGAHGDRRGGGSGGGVGHVASDGGKGGTAAAAAGGVVTNFSVGGPTDVLNPTMAGGAGSALNGAVGIANNNVIRPTGGGGGSGINSSNTTGAATGAGGVINGTGFLVSTPIAGGAAGGSLGGNGSDGNTSAFRVGTGGGGGRSGDTAGTVAAGKGGAGGNYGAGGGGGGASTNGANSGAGGDGAPGYVRIETLIQN